MLPHPTQTADDLRALATCQRWLMGVLYLQVSLWGLNLVAVAGEADVPGLFAVSLVLSSVIGLFGALFAFILASQLRGGLEGGALGLAATLPCLGVAIVILLVFQAMKVFRDHGVRNGLLGPRSGDLRDLDETLGNFAYEPAEDDEDGW